MTQNRTPDGWTSDNSLSGKRSDAPCPPCTICGQPMYYMFGMVGVFKMHEDTDEFLCREETPRSASAEALRNEVEED